MPHHQHPRRIAFIGLLLLLASLSHAQENLVPEGQFISDRGRAKGWVESIAKQGWLRDNFRVETEGERSFIRSTKSPALIEVQKPIQPQWAELELKVQTRRQSVQPGKNRWDVPLVELDFLDSKGKSLLDWKKATWLDGDTDGWETKSRVYPVPAGAVTLVARIGNKSAAGTVDFADLSVTAVKLKSAEEVAAAQAQIDPAQKEIAEATARAERERTMLKTVDPGKVTGAQIDESTVATTIHVDAKAADGGDGSQAKPFKTFGAALKAADKELKALRPVKIQLAPGTYREGNYVIKGGEMNKPQEDWGKTLLVIEGAPGAETIISGSELYAPSEWKPVAGAEGVYEHAWPHDLGNEQGPWGQYNPKKLLGHRSEMVFFNGEPLKQVILEDYEYIPGKGWSGKGQHNYKGFLDPAATLEPGTFGVAERDENGNRIFIKPPADADFASAKIEVTTKRHLLHSHYKSNLVLRNLVFEHAASTHSTIHAALMIGHWHHEQRTLLNDNILLDNIVVRHNNGFGAKVGWGRNITVRNSTFQYNGHSGLNTGVVSNVLMENCDFSYNNWRGHLGGLYGWAVAGTKQHQTRDAVLRNITAYGNMGPGIWYDVNNTNVTIENAVVVGNRRNIFLEISDGPFLVRNVLAVADRHVGLVLTNHGHLTVEDSIFHGAARQLISVCANDNRGSSNTIEAALGLQPFIAEERGEVVGDKKKKVHLVGPTKFVNSVFVNSGRLVMQDPSSPDLYQDWIQNLLTVQNVVWHSKDPKPFGLGYIDRQMGTHEQWAQKTGEEGAVFTAVPFAAPEKFDFRLTGPVANLDGSRLPARAVDPARLDAIRAFFARYEYGGGSEYADDPLARSN
jgi:hypothetical protein